ncbi:MAG TPA: DUF4491 family protein [Anaerolineales bacterium]|nr:DUF4491 family protein [Anaerolineales bacterium]
MMNLIGLSAAFATFLSIWFGHVAVRKIEFNSPSIWLPASAFAIVGITFEWLSLIASSFFLSTTCGIIGITLLWDALEFTRQQNRIKKGHAPANPDNPRHVRLMREYTSVTTLNLLKRDPIDEPVSHSETIQLLTKH